MKNKTLSVAGLLLVIVSMVFISAHAYAALTNSEISACVKENGVLHVVGSEFKREDCKKKETLLTWNTQGLKGDKGDAGVQGPKGDAGATGPQGEKGDTGPAGSISGTTVVSNSATGGSQDSVTADATCPSGKILLSGGAKVTNIIAASRAFITASYPISPSTWRGSASAVDAGAGELTITTYAICSQ